MTKYRIHTIESAPSASKAALEALKKTFGFVPNVAGAMAGSPVLISAFVPIFRQVHAGSFSEAEIQVALLTNAVTNAAAWPVALHSKLAVDAGVSADDVQAIRARRSPMHPKLAALSGLARALIEKRGHLDDEDTAAFQGSAYGPDAVLEVITIVAASAMTNYTSSVAETPLEDALKPYEWSAAAAVE